MSVNKFIRRIILALCILIAAGTLNAKPTDDTLNSSAYALQNSETLARPIIQYPLVWDKHFGPIAGITTLLSLHRGLSYFIDTILSEGNSCSSVTLKTALTALPLDAFIYVLSHEFNGHGARARQCGFTDIKYGFTISSDLGVSGVTYLTPPENRIVTDAEWVVVTIGGMEQGALIAKTLILRWGQRGAIQRSEAIMYYFGALDSLYYIFGTTKEEVNNGESTGNDVVNYIRGANELYGSPDLSKLTLADMKLHVLGGLLNPFLFYSLYAAGVGESNYQIPWIQLGKIIRWMPFMRFGLSPYGTELFFENIISGDNKVLNFYYCYGIPKLARFWGIGIQYLNFVDLGFLQISGRLDVWKHPAIELGGATRAAAISGGYTIHASLTVFITLFKLNKAGNLISVFAECAYKNEGYIEAIELDGGPIIRAGLSFGGF